MQLGRMNRNARKKLLLIQIKQMIYSMSITEL